VITVAELLVVEDEKNMSSHISSLLDEMPAKITVSSAFTGEDALRILHEKQIDGALVDIELPGMNGFELARKIRNSNRYHLLPLVFVTGTAEDIPDIYKEFHNFDFIEKPFPKERFYAVMDRMLDEIGKTSGIRGISFEKVIKIELPKDTLIVKVNGIFYIRRLSRQLYLVTEDGEIKLSENNVSGFLKYVDSPMFARSSKSCAVNVLRIKRIHMLTRKTWDIYFDEAKDIKCELSHKYYANVLALCDGRVAITSGL
jgi:two-component system LytT family response regulator